MEPIGYDAFLGQFKFRPEFTGFVAAEREAFFRDKNGLIVPWAPRLIPTISMAMQGVSYELSAGQVETKVGPLQLERLRERLSDQDLCMQSLERQLGFTRLFQDVAPADMPLDIYPDPRYARIAEGMPNDRLLAACRIIGTHFHFGMRDMEMALRAYEALRQEFPRLRAKGDRSSGERLRIYEEVAGACEPPHFASARAFYENACARGFAPDPRSCWDLIRISPHGTVEVRVFSATDSLLQIEEWAADCHTVAMSA